MKRRNDVTTAEKKLGYFSSSLVSHALFFTDLIWLAAGKGGVFLPHFYSLHNQVLGIGDVIVLPTSALLI